MKKLLYMVALEYLRLAAKLQLLKMQPIIIGVAGSSGKTSLTRLVYEMLCDRFTVKGSEGKNSETGIPLDILDIHMSDTSLLTWLLTFLLVPWQLLTNWKKYQYYIAEMGIDSPVEPKNMSYLLRIIQPTIGVVTNVSLEHSMYFEPYATEIDPEKKQQEVLSMTAEQETLLLRSLSTDGVAIVNVDDEEIRKSQKSIAADQVTVSLEKDADLIGKDMKNTLSEFSMKVEFEGASYPLTISQPLPLHYAYEFLLAIAIGGALDLSVDDCIASLEKNFSLPAGRLSFFKGIKNTTIIDSTYNNATLPPILDILDFTKEIAGKKRKVAIIGDMRELGEESQFHHEEVAKRLIKTVDFAILIGPQLDKYAIPILKKVDFPFENFPDVTSAKVAILRTVQHGDVVLVKGSQNTLFLERVVELVLADKKDVAKLTRRGEFWDKKRSETL